MTALAVDVRTEVVPLRHGLAAVLILRCPRCPLTGGTCDCAETERDRRQDLEQESKR